MAILTRNLDDLTNKVENLEKEMAARQQTLEEQVCGVQRSFVARLPPLEEAMTRMQANLDELCSKQESTVDALNKLGQSVEQDVSLFQKEIQTQIQEFHTEVANHAKRVDLQMNEALGSVAAQLLQLEQMPLELQNLRSQKDLWEQDLEVLRRSVETGRRQVEEDAEKQHSQMRQLQKFTESELIEVRRSLYPLLQAESCTTDEAVVSELKKLEERINAGMQKLGSSQANLEARVLKLQHSKNWGSATTFSGKSAEEVNALNLAASSATEMQGPSASHKFLRRLQQS